MSKIAFVVEHYRRISPLKQLLNWTPLYTKLASKFCSRLEEFKVTGQAVNLSNPFRSLATDLAS